MVNSLGAQQSGPLWELVVSRKSNTELITVLFKNTQTLKFKVAFTYNYIFLLPSIIISLLSQAMNLDH